MTTITHTASIRQISILSMEELVWKVIIVHPVVHPMARLARIVTFARKAAFQVTKNTKCIFYSCTLDRK